MIYVTYWEGWVLAHPASVLITVACAGTLTVLAILMHAENRRDDREDGLPEAPRRGPRSRARGTRARRHAFLGSAYRRARAIAAWATSWFWWCGAWHPWQAARERLALRARGITIDVTGSEPAAPKEVTPSAPRVGQDHDARRQRLRVSPGDPPAGITKNAGHGGSPDQAATDFSGLRLPGRPRRAVLAARARRAARGALMASVPPGRPGQKACPRCGAAHKEPHCADGREWGPFPGPETPGNGCGQPRTPPNGCEFPPGPPHGLPVSGPGGATGPARLATGAGQPRQQETPPGGYGRALEPWRGPRLHYAAGLCWCGQYHDQREPTPLAAGAGQDAARLDYQPAEPFADCLSAETIARGMKAVK